MMKKNKKRDCWRGPSSKRDWYFDGI